MRGLRGSCELLAGAGQETALLLYPFRTYFRHEHESSFFLPVTPCRMRRLLPSVEVWKSCKSRAPEPCLSVATRTDQPGQRRVPSHIQYTESALDGVPAQNLEGDDERVEHEV